jgi:predicted PurR-regulated permease PerM
LHERGAMNDWLGGRSRWQRLAFIIGFIFVVWLFLRLFAPILLPFVTAGGIAYFLDPPVSALARWRIPRAAGALLMLLALIAACLLFALLLYPLAAAQINLLITQLPAAVATVQKFATHEIILLQTRLGPGFVPEKLKELVGGQAGSIVAFVGTAARRVIGGGFALFNVLTLLIITPIVAFYLLRDWPLMVARIDSWIPRAYESVVRNLAQRISKILNAWIRGQAICCLFLAIFYATSLSIIGLNLGLVIGLAAGLLSFIPYVGTIIGAVSAIVIALGQYSGWNGVIIVAAIFVAGQALNDYIVAPRFLGDRVGLSAVWVIFALFAGAETFGFLGVLLAVPVTATLGVLARFWLERYLQSPLYLDPPRHNF